MEHVTYPKIPAVLAGASSAGPWIATEKIHGAQLTIAYNAAALEEELVLDVLVDLVDAFPALLARDDLEAVVRAAVVARFRDSTVAEAP